MNMVNDKRMLRLCWYAQQGSIVAVKLNVVDLEKLQGPTPEMNERDY